MRKMLFSFDLVEKAWIAQNLENVNAVSDSKTAKLTLCLFAKCSKISKSVFGIC